MGTRSLTIFKDGKSEICRMYRQMDGYPQGGHGQELAGFLAGFAIVNGYNSTMPDKIANGMSCLAAQIISHFKDGVGGFYLCPPRTKDCGEEYTYTIYDKKGVVEPCLKVVEVGWNEGDNVLFDGPASECLAWIGSLK